MTSTTLAGQAIEEERHKRESVYAVAMKVCKDVPAVPVWTNAGIAIHRIQDAYSRACYTDYNVDSIPGYRHCLISNSMVIRYYRLLNSNGIGRVEMALESLMTSPDSPVIEDDYFEV